MAQIGSDSFTGTPGDALSTYNPAWVSVPGLTGVMTITSGGDKTSLSTASATAAYFRSDISPPSLEYSVSADILFSSLVVSGPAIGVISGASESVSTHYEARYLSNGSGNGALQLRRLINGTATTLSTLANSHVSGETKNIRFARSASSPRQALYLNQADTPFITADDTSITEIGRTGIRTFNGSSSRYQLDNFSVDTAQAGGVVDTPVVPGQGNLVFAGYSPTIERTANTGISPSATSLALASYAPTIEQTANQTVSPGAKVFGIAGYAPTVSVGVVEVPGSTTITPAPQTPPFTLAGFAPLIVRGDSKTFSPGQVQMTIVGYAPSITRGGTPVNATVQYRYMKRSKLKIIRYA